MVRIHGLPGNDWRVSKRGTGAMVLAILAASLLCVASAPLLMPESYSIVQHSVSESAAQRVEGVWLARAGLLGFGLGVLALASASGERWGLWGRVAHRAYGGAIISSAAFAHMPWQDLPYDEFEDLLHSIASFVVGLGFVAGVIVVGAQRRRPTRWVRAFDGVAVVASVVIPMIMFNLEGYAGLVQRVMFLVAYAWYGLEARRVALPAVESDV